MDDNMDLIALAGATGAFAVGGEPRGLLATADLPPRTAVVDVPLRNALVLSDEPTSSITVFSDRHHVDWQRNHGELPPALLEFLQGALQLLQPQLSLQPPHIR